MKIETKRTIQKISVVLFVLYLILLIYFLFFAESYGRALRERAYSYNLEPLKEIKRFWEHREQLGYLAVFTNLAGNVLCFMPFGAILPILNRKTRNVVLITLLSMEFSLMVEIIQLVSKVGSFDVDDILLNTLGGMAGYLVFYICNKVRRKVYG